MLRKTLDKHFQKLIDRESGLLPEKFFSIKWETYETIPLFHRYSHVSFLKKLPQQEKDLYLLECSLKHLNVLVDYFSQHDAISKQSDTLLVLKISDWHDYPENPLLFDFFIAYNCHELFDPPRPLVQPHTKESAYILNLLGKLNITDDYFVYDNSPSTKEFQDVYVGLKKHPCERLVTLDHFVKCD